MTLGRGGVGAVHRLPSRRVNYGKNFEHRDTKKLFKMKGHDMKPRKPGRKSAAELGLKISALSVRRLDPPEELSPDEKETWKAVTKTKPADWWRPDTYPLLISYCKHTANAKHVDYLIETFNFDGIKNDFDL
jgi:hypothetical protein